MVNLLTARSYSSTTDPHSTSLISHLTAGRFQRTTGIPASMNSGLKSAPALLPRFVDALPRRRFIRNGTTSRRGCFSRYSRLRVPVFVTALGRASRLAEMPAPATTSRSRSYT